MDERVRSLRGDLLALLAGVETRRELEGVLIVCHSLAVAHLRNKRSAWRLMDFHGINQADLAYDCIAELFRRDEDGSLAELIAYFKDLDVAGSDSSGILIHLRRLVFAKTNRHLSHLSAESDTFFFRTVRNIRNALATTGLFVEIDRFGEPTLMPQKVELLRERPFHPEHQLSQLVLRCYSLSSTMPCFIQQLYNGVCDQQEYCRLVPLLPMVSVIKEVNEKQSCCDGESSLEPGGLSEETARQVVALAREDTRRRFHEAYVQKGKVTARDFAAYLNAIQSILLLRISTDDGHDTSLYTSLKSELGEMSEEQYRELHRARIEYIARYMHNRVAERLK